MLIFIAWSVFLRLKAYPKANSTIPIKKYVLDPSPMLKKTNMNELRTITIQQIAFNTPGDTLKDDCR